VPILLHGELEAVLWIRISFSADPDSDPTFSVYSNPDADPDPSVVLRTKNGKKFTAKKFFIKF
jgi:hypothetical protein